MIEKNNALCAFVGGIWLKNDLKNFLDFFEISFENDSEILWIFSVDLINLIN